MELLTLTSVQVVRAGPRGKGSLLPAACADTRYLAKFCAMGRSREVCDPILLSPPFCPGGVVPAELRRQILAAGQQLLRVEALPCLTLGETLASLASAPLLTQPFAASLWEAVPCCGARGVLGKAGSCLSARVGSPQLARGKPAWHLGAALL